MGWDGYLPDMGLVEGGHGTAARRTGRGLHGADQSRVLVAGLCIESKLPLVTASPARFRRVPGLTVISAEHPGRHETGEDVLRAAGVRI